MAAALRTDDGVRIEAAYAPFAGPGSPGGPGGSEARSEARSGARSGAPGGTALVVAHGFTGSLARPALRRAARALTAHGAVVTFSFRGHGRSGGRSTVGDLEVLDLAAAVRWARSLGHRRVATIGFSMGGSVVLRHAGLHRAPAEGDAWPAHTDAVVAVSAAARWYYRGTAPMRRLHWAIQRPAGRVLSRWALRTRVHSEEWDPVPLSPVAAARLIPPVPLLVVHGDRDPYFPLDHPRSLAEAAGPEGAELWIERGYGHAENAAPPELLDRIGAWAVSAAEAVPAAP